MKLERIKEIANTLKDLEDELSDAAVAARSAGAAQEPYIYDASSHVENAYAELAALIVRTEEGTL